MPSIARDAKLAAECTIGDEVLVERIVAGDTRYFAVIVRRYNQRLYRAARAITADDNEAEDAVQQTYLAAFRSLSSFEGRCRLSTWLTRIAIHEAIARRRNASRLEAVRRAIEREREDDVAPEAAAAQRETARILEAAIDDLPEEHRVALVLRDLEGMSAAEVAQTLLVSEANVRVRHFRARAALRRALRQRYDIAEAFAFAGTRCAGMLTRVMTRIYSDELRDAV